MIIYIYIIKCPYTNEIKYVGKTNNPNRRSKNHCNQIKKNRTPINIWENKIITEGKRPIFEILEECDQEIWAEREMFWIKEFKDNGFLLLNSTKGGDAINVPITKNHNSVKLKGRKFEDYYSIEKSNDIKKKISKSSSGINNPNYGSQFICEEYINKQIESNSKIHIELVDIGTNDIYLFRNSKEASIFLNCSQSTIREAKRMGYKVKKQYLVRNKI